MEEAVVDDERSSSQMYDVLCVGGMMCRAEDGWCDFARTENAGGGGVVNLERGVGDDGCTGDDETQERTCEAREICACEARSNGRAGDLSETGVATDEFEGDIVYDPVPKLLA